MRRILALLAALCALTVLVPACGDGGGEGWGWLPPDQETPKPEGREAVTSTPGPERADVPRMRCGTLLTMDKDIEEALGEEGTSLYGRGEVCRSRLVTDERFFVGMEPGAPGDFQPGAELLGVPGEPVSGVGDDARWFGGTGAEGGGTAGILSVRQSTSLGALHFRIELGRPDLDSAAQLEIAKNLALSALPRFPGVEFQEPEPEVVTFEREQVDRSNASFVDNLLAKELAGEWTRGEGLVATLSLFAGEVEAAQVLRQPDLIDYEGTGTFEMAYEYLEDGPDAEAKAEITRLLDLLVFSNDQLEAMAGLGPPTAAHPGQLALGTARGPEEDCLDFFHGAIPPGVSQCLEVGLSDLLEDLYTGEYRIFFPAPSLPAAGWKDDRYELAMEAMEETVPIYAEMGEMYAEMGEMPSVNIVFSVAGPGYATAFPKFGKPCGVVLYTKLIEFKPSDFKQVVAHELGHCFQTETFPKQQVAYKVRRWREEGLADYLSNVVYPKNNLEHRHLDRLAAMELSTTLVDYKRGYTGSLFFQYLYNRAGDEGIFDLVRGLPSDGGRAKQEDALAEYEGIERLIHTFAQGLTDENIRDSGQDIGGPGPIPYKARADTIPISDPIVLLEDPQRFGVVRLHLVVDPGKYACVEYEKEGELRSSWRAGKPGKPGGSWSNDLPESLQGEAVFVVTTTEEGATFTVSVTDVDDDPECEDEEDESEPTPCPIEIGCPPSEYYY